MKLVTAIMPTRGRGPMAAQALSSYCAQTYQEKQLLILDDADEPSFPGGFMPTLPGVSYMRLDRREGISKKRNECCRLAAGEIIVHWDSDDWSAPTRIADQVRILEESGKSMTGYYSMLFYCQVECEDNKYYRYQGSPHYAIGTSFAYTKEWWKRHPFVETKKIGEDNEMVFAARNEKELIAVDGGQMMVARIHPNNTAPKYLHGTQYHKVSRSDFPEAFFQ